MKKQLLCDLCKIVSVGYDLNGVFHDYEAVHTTDGMHSLYTCKACATEHGLYTLTDSEIVKLGETA